MTSDQERFIDNKDFFIKLREFLLDDTGSLISSF
jgi:hypothetical protein